jgi:hypothetical protein
MVSLPATSFLHSLEYLGFKHGARRWRGEGGDRVYEWDDHHGHVEGYTKRGRHVGVFDAITGVKVGEPVKGRKIDV